LLFHCNSGCTNAPQCCVIRILPVLFFTYPFLVLRTATAHSIANNLHNYLPFPLIRLLVSGWLMTVLSCRCFLLMWKSKNIHTLCHQPHPLMTFKTPGPLASRTEFCVAPYQRSTKFTKLDDPGNRDDWDPKFKITAFLDLPYALFTEKSSDFRKLDYFGCGWHVFGFHREEYVTDHWFQKHGSRTCKYPITDLPLRFTSP
jgi:hypothetical protein